ncbi:MAG: hypothetical protein CNE98_03070 [Bacteroidetes bacterium MED-G17]|nr:MAG: hypothetical protein CBB99_05435 [Bacteroidetes bacterium TMED39]PDH52710.1 MAG: hypothetical protein CNE98_03070 [Bacteroidetes bacterium MED-G17]|tara:strand:+ start:6237 stop:6431 length:195 start_codon:yes stop_codon:yes gene_type:complete
MTDISTYSIINFYSKKLDIIPPKELVILQKIKGALDSERDKYFPSATTVDIILETSRELNALGV